jgi:hypothetical protein
MLEPGLVRTVANTGFEAAVALATTVEATERSDPLD